MAKPLKFTVKKTPNRLQAPHTSTLLVTLDEPPTFLFIRVRRGKQINKKLPIAVCELNRCDDDKEIMIDVKREEKELKELLVIFNKKADLEEFFKVSFPHSFAPLQAKRIAEEKKKQAAIEEEKKKLLAIEELKKKVLSPTAKTIFDGNLEAAVKAGGGLIPVVCADCILRLRTEEALKTVGIFRVAPDSAELGEVMYNYAEQKKVSLWGLSPHIAAGALKRYLRQLTIPLIPFNLYAPFMETNNIVEIDARITETSKLISSLPKDNFHLLESIIVFLAFVTTFSEINLMGASNCAVVFGQCILWDTDPGITTNNILKHNSVVEFLINNAKQLFPEAEPVSIHIPVPETLEPGTPISTITTSELDIPSFPPPRPSFARQQLAEEENSSSSSTPRSSTPRTPRSSTPRTSSHNFPSTSDTATSSFSSTTSEDSTTSLAPPLPSPQRGLTPPPIPKSYSGGGNSLDNSNNKSGTSGDRSASPSPPNGTGSRTLILPPASPIKIGPPPLPADRKINNHLRAESVMVPDTLGAPLQKIKKSRSHDTFPRATTPNLPSSASSSSSQSTSPSPVKAGFFSHLTFGGHKTRPTTPSSESQPGTPIAQTPERESRSIFKAPALFKKTNTNKK